MCSLQHGVCQLTDCLQHLVLLGHQLVLHHELLDELLVERLDQSGVSGNDIGELPGVRVDEVLPAELVVACPVSEGLGGEGGSHHPGGGGVTQQLVVGLGQQLAAVVGDALTPCHPPGQDLVQVGVQSGARKLQPLLWHQAGAAGAEHAGARHHVERERAGGLAAGQPGPKLADWSLLWYLQSHNAHKGVRG